jgi:hypothetical protein
LESVGEREPAPGWWTAQLRIGQSLELIVYGERMAGRLTGVAGASMEARVAVPEQVPALALTKVTGTVAISVPGGVASAPVLCWSAGTTVMIQVTGPVELVQRRAHQRRVLDVPVALTWPSSRHGGWERALARTADISVGGLRVQFAHVAWPSPGVPVSLVVDLPGGAISVEATVIGKTSDYGLRMGFVECPTTVAERIARYVDLPTGR